MTIDGKRNFIINVVYALFILVLLIGVLRFVIPCCWPFILGFGIAYVLKTISEPLVRRMRLSRKHAAAIAALLFYAFAGCLVWVLFAVLFGQIGELANWLPGFYRESLLPVLLTVNDWIANRLSSLAPQVAVPVNELFAAISRATGELISTFSAAAIAWLTQIVTKLPLYLVGFIFTIVSSFLISLDYKNVSTFLMRQAPKPLREVIIDVKNFLVSCVLKMGKAYFLIMLITFIELAAGLWLLKVEAFWQIAAVIAVLDILPIIGSGAVLLPWGVYHLISGSIPLGTGILLLYGVITLVRNIIEPKIVGDTIGLPPVATLAAMFFGIKVLGLGGVLLAPIAVLLIKYLNDTGRVRLYKN